MKIFFYANINIYDEGNGISKKVLSQVKALRKMGNEVFLSTYTNHGVEILDNDNQVIYHQNYNMSARLFHYFRREILISNICKYLRKSEPFEMCYVRFHFFDYYYWKMLRMMHQNSKVIVEAHGYPYRKVRKSIISLYVNVRDVIFEPFCRKYIDLVAAISNCENIWKCKTIFIDNAIDIDSVKIKKQKSIENNIKLISVAIEQPYHGFDKLIKGLAEYYTSGGKRNIYIYMVGEYCTNTKELVRKFGLENSIIFVGKLYGKELDALYDEADLGIGSFSMRANCEYGSSIKTKEYFAKGLPFINGWREYTFDDTYPYVKRFDLHKDSIDFNEVVSFYEQLKNEKDVQKNMREFAEEHFTWEKQFFRILKN